MALLGMDKVRELVWVAHEEHGGVVADQIPVALARLEFHREAAHVAFGIGCTELTGHGGKAQNERRAGAWLQQFCLGIPRNVATDLERAVSAPSLRVHRALRNSLSVLVR